MFKRIGLISVVLGGLGMTAFAQDGYYFGNPYGDRHAREERIERERAERRQWREREWREREWRKQEARERARWEGGYYDRDGERCARPYYGYGYGR